MSQALCAEFKEQGYIVEVRDGAQLMHIRQIRTIEDAVELLRSNPHYKVHLYHEYDHSTETHENGWKKVYSELNFDKLSKRQLRKILGLNKQIPHYVRVKLEQKSHVSL